eukprot:14025974-Alexandrium_andersonii.AAC.1
MCIRDRLSEPELPWLLKAEVRAATRNQQAAAELASTVRKARRAGTFEVASSQAGLSYSVEVDLRASPGTAPAEAAQSCECMDHVKRGPICKHVGAVLLALAAEQREKAE